MTAVTYKTIELLCSGGMAEILVAVARQESGFVKPCIVKRVLPPLRADPTYAALLRYEARIGQALSHANIVQVQGFARVEGHDAIIMEFVEGVDLEHVLKTCARGAMKLSTPMSIQITAEIARALHYVHSRGDLVTGKGLKLVHADVTPGNVMISFEGEVKLGDFGIASARLEGGASDLLAYRGKRTYMPPEQHEGKSLEPAADLFALGCVLFEMLCGKRLLTEDAERFTAIPGRLATDLAGQQEDLRQIVAKMVDFVPANRYQSAAALERDLLQLLEEKHGGLARQRLGVFVQTTHTKEQRRCHQLLKAAMERGEAMPATPEPFAAVPPTRVMAGPAPAPVPTPTTPNDPQRDVLHRGKDLSLALPRAEVERVRNKFILDQESSVRSRTSAGSSSVSQQPHRAVRPTMPPAPARPPLARRGIRLWVAALLLALMAAGAVLYSTGKGAKVRQAAHPAPHVKEGPRGSTP